MKKWRRLMVEISLFITVISIMKVKFAQFPFLEVLLLSVLVMSPQRRHTKDLITFANVNDAVFNFEQKCNF